ncbi:hypothetical protein LCGC14_2245260 [marine sediment metagenome]|uniref:Uncharacterized protein n=1 Tax=marine sediment metagenome TaxID=412755 RepID=A0A0F9FGT1_9ZZZZ
MTGWRPEGWVNPYPITARYDDPRYMDGKAHESFEAGADAIYEPAYQKGYDEAKLEDLFLKEQQTLSEIKIGQDRVENWKKRKKWIAFIPEEV